MRILRSTGVVIAGVVAIALLTGLTINGQGKSESKTSESKMPGKMSMTGTMLTKDQKIANALTAAPASVTAKATIVDWPTKEGETPAVLRTGTNRWTCLPDMPDTEGNDPTCLDKPWMTWVAAYLAHTAPEISTVGIGYMTAPGGAWGSNTDPYARAKTPENQWGHHAPHLMILVPDLKALQGMSTDPKSGEPYVMYSGTPDAHIMAPILDGNRK